MSYAAERYVVYPHENSVMVICRECNLDPDLEHSYVCGFLSASLFKLVESVERHEKTYHAYPVKN